MAKVHFLFRSNGYSANLSARLQFSHKGKEFLIGATTKRNVKRCIWFTYYLNYSKRNFSAQQLREIKFQTEDILTTAREKKDGANELNNEKNKLENFVVDKFEKISPSQYHSEYLKPWFQSVVDEFYNPDCNRISKEVPTDLVTFIDYFIEHEDLNEIMIRKYKVLKTKLEKFSSYRRKPIEIAEIDNVFRKEFIAYSKDVAMYSDHTIFRDFGYITTLCTAAGIEGINLSKKYKDFKAPSVKKIIHEILTPDEIVQVENLKGLTPSLDNVRDLFLVSLYTGQRIGDFMRFNENMIREENGQLLLEFEQSKTGELMSIPIIPKLQAILQKNGGKFPRRISDAKYNEYLKKVLKIAGFTNEVWGRKLVEVSDGIWRKQDAKLPRYEFFSSHAGRRSFASNAFGKMPISDIMYLTGHTVEKTFLIYVNKKKTERAHEAAPKLAALYSDDNSEKEILDQLKELVKAKNIDFETLLKTLKQK